MSVNISFELTHSYFLKPVFSSGRFFAVTATMVLTLCAAFLVFPAATEAKTEAEPVAVVDSMSGDFEHRQAGADKYAVVKRGNAVSMKLYNRDALRTPESVSGIIETEYGARIELKEKTEIEFGVFSVRIKKGDMWINYKRRGDGGAGDNFKVLTPAGTIGIKGTAFRTVVSEENDEVKIFVTEGVVSFTSESGDVKIVEAGSGLTIDADGKSAAPIKNEELDQKDGTMPNGEQGDDNVRKNSEKNKNIDNGKTGKPLQIEDGSSVNTEVNPFE